jgi:hypothetical protein
MTRLNSISTCSGRSTSSRRIALRLSVEFGLVERALVEALTGGVAIHGYLVSAMRVGHG